MGLASCNNESKSPVETPEGQSIGDTYVGLDLKFPTSAAPRANNPKEDYNKIEGEWKGRDAIESITVYLVTEGKAVTSQHFNKDDFSGIDNNGHLNPKLAVEAVSGDKVKAYVVINDVNNKIINALSNAGWTLGQKVEHSAKSTSEFETAFTKAVELSDVADVAVYDASAKKDKIIMTNEALPTAANKGEISVQGDVSKEDAKQGVKNRLEVNVSRVASRAIVTIDKNADKTIEVKRTNLKTSATETTATITIKDVKYAATGGALKFNPIQSADYKTPKDVYDGKLVGTKWSEVIAGAAGVFTFKDTYKEVQTLEGTTVDASKLATALGAEDFSKLLLPVTHADNNYKKGNTPFFTIQVTFTVENKLDGAEDLSSHTGNIFYGKTDGLFYSTLKKAQLMDASATGNDEVPADQQKQQVVKYVNGKMYYNIWINPDVPYTNTDKKISKSPVYRNQVYNAHITGFKEIGLSWTPNNDPKDPDDDNPDPEDPDDPFNPGDDLETNKTYLSVQLKVLPYTLHSYTVDLGNRY